MSADKAIQPRPALFNALDPSVTDADAFAAKKEVSAIMDKSGLPYVASVMVLGGRHHVRVMTENPVMESHGLPEKIGRVTVTYSLLNSLEGFVNRSPARNPAPRAPQP